MNHHRGPRVWQVAVWRGRLRRLIAAGWQALITLRWRLLRRWRMIDPRCQGPRDAAHSWRTTARAPRRRHRCTRLVDLANAPCFAPIFFLQTLTYVAKRTKFDNINRELRWPNAVRYSTFPRFFSFLFCFSIAAIEPLLERNRMNNARSSL